MTETGRSRIIGLEAKAWQIGLVTPSLCVTRPRELALNLAWQRSQHAVSVHDGGELLAQVTERSVMHFLRGAHAERVQNSV